MFGVIAEIVIPQDPNFHRPTSLDIGHDATIRDASLIQLKG